MKTNLTRASGFFHRMVVMSLTLLLGCSLWAQIPEGYYSTAEGKSKGELKTALHNKIKVGKRLSYGSGTSSTWSGFEKSDLHPSGYVWDMYSNNKRYFPGNGGAVSGMNIEHSVAKSWWGGSNNDAYKDLYHLNPSDAAANSARSNYPLGTNSGSRFNNGSIKVGNNTYGSGYNGLCFEPLDEYKGDFARAYLYMFTCYENFNWSGTEAPTMLIANETYPMLKSWAKDLLVEWSRKDPVSEKERNRAEAIYKIQQNRNPFIDHPELVEYLWGNKVGQAFTTNQTDPVITAPVHNTTIQLPSTHYTATSKTELQVLAQRLTTDLTLSLSGSQASQFSLSASKLTKEEAMTGKMVTITFIPTKAETATAQLTISGGGVATPVVVTLQAAATDNFSALPATNINHTGFTANWTTSSTAANYELNVYQIITESNGGFKTLVETNFDEMPAGWSKGGYTEVSSGEIRLSSGKQDGSISSPQLDLSTPATLMLKAKRYGSDASPLIYIKVDGQQVGAVTTEDDYKVFNVELPAATTGSQIEIYAVKGKRVYITEMSITVGSEKITNQPLEGFPLQTGLTTSFQVTGLSPLKTYYYTVKTVGSQVSQTQAVEVITKSATSVEDVELDKVKLTTKDRKLYLFDLPQNSTIRVMDISGKQLIGKTNVSGTEILPVQTRGIVLIRIEFGKATRIEKVMIL